MNDKVKIKKGFDIVQIIGTTRRLLKETNDEFGSRFGVTGEAARRWQSGSEASYKVIEFCLDTLFKKVQVLQSQLNSQKQDDEKRS